VKEDSIPIDSPPSLIEGVFPLDQEEPSESSISREDGYLECNFLLKNLMPKFGVMAAEDIPQRFTKLSDWVEFSPQIRTAPNQLMKASVRLCEGYTSGNIINLGQRLLGYQ
jgi:hypothetical protein